MRDAASHTETRKRKSGHHKNGLLAHSTPKTTLRSKILETFSLSRVPGISKKKAHRSSPFLWSFEHTFSWMQWNSSKALCPCALDINIAHCGLGDL
ncbi:hypothetical protein CK203_019324 [Vitis vinifera]|uniref:Uncharacterized protein n=1 Tax=Vitis vinifera TaxID=29760 RepID=A0A438J7T0_VITVI|nr:hypothetical protein CK203_019324 [Vitis vinifera]